MLSNYNLDSNQPTVTTIYIQNMTKHKCYKINGGTSNCTTSSLQITNIHSISSDNREASGSPECAQFSLTKRQANCTYPEGQGT